MIRARREPLPEELTRSPKGWIATVIATGFGSGLSPIAPGTAGSLVGVALLWSTREWDVLQKIALIGLILIPLGTWSARALCRATKTRDDQRIVVDEVIGMVLSGLTLAPSFWNYALAFVLFRFFDITKLPPARQADRWSKSLALTATWRIGFGTLLDDIIAGLQGLALIETTRQIGFLS